MLIESIMNYSEGHYITSGYLVHYNEKEGLNTHLTLPQTKGRRKNPSCGKIIEVLQKGWIYLDMDQQTAFAKTRVPLEAPLLAPY